MTTPPPTPAEPEPEPERRPDAQPADEFLPGPGAYPAVPPAGVTVLALQARPRRWWATRADVRSAALVVGSLAVVGLLVGVLWYLLAPRVGFHVDASGVPLRTGPSEAETEISADGWYVLLTAVVGLLAGVAVWSWRSARGPLVAAALAAGGLLGAFLVARIGHLLGPGPTTAQLHQVGRVGHGALELRSKVALVVEPFLAVAAYVVGAGFAGEDDLGRPDGR